MADERPQLRLVDTETGEVVEDERELLIEELQRELKGKSLTIGKLRAEIRDLRMVEPEAQAIMDVLTYWRDRCMPNASIAHGGRRWEKARARMREKLDNRDPLRPAELKLAVDGALTDPWHTQAKMGHRLDAEYLFRNYESVEKLRDLAIGFQARAGASLRNLADVADELNVVDWRVELRICVCGHRRIQHAPHDAREICTAHDCGCEDFDQSFLMNEDR